MINYPNWELYILEIKKCGFCKVYYNFDSNGNCVRYIIVKNMMIINNAKNNIPDFFLTMTSMREKINIKYCAEVD